MDSDKKLNLKLNLKLNPPDADADAGVTTLARLFFLRKVELKTQHNMCLTPIYATKLKYCKLLRHQSRKVS